MGAGDVKRVNTIRTGRAQTASDAPDRTWSIPPPSRRPTS